MEGLSPEARSALEGLLAGISDAVVDVAGQGLRDAQESIAEAVASGDVGAVEEIFAGLQAQLEELPPELREALGEFEDRLGRRMRRALRRATEAALEGAQEAILGMTQGGALSQSLDKLTADIAAQRAVIEQAAISEGRRRRELEKFDAVADQVFGEFAARISGQLNSGLTGLAQKFGVAIDDQNLLIDLRRAEFEQQIGFLEIQANILLGMQAISQETADGIFGLIGRIREAAEAADFLPVTAAPPPPTILGGASGGGVSGEFDLTTGTGIRDALAAWERSILGVGNPLLEEALNIEAKRAEFEAAILEFGNDFQMGELVRINALAVSSFVDNVLEPFDRLGESPLVRQLGDLVQQFDDIQEAFDALVVSDEQRLEIDQRLSEARAAALSDFWEQATAPLQGFLDELTASDPRRTSEELFATSQERFRDLAARAAAGDLEALQELEAAGRDFLAQSQAFLGEGSGALAVRDEIADTIASILGGGVDPFILDSDTVPPGDQAILDALGDVQTSALEGVDETNAILSDIRVLLGGARSGTARPTDRPIFAPDRPRNPSILRAESTRRSDSRAQRPRRSEIADMVLAAGRFAGDARKPGRDAAEAAALREVVRQMQEAQRRKDRQRREDMDRQERIERAKMERQEAVIAELRAGNAQRAAVIAEQGRGKGLLGGAIPGS
jgi:hypothetical protein